MSNARIHQVPCFLNALVKDLRTGSMLPAKFQRPYVWSRSDCLALYNSILRRYPTGSVVLWTPRPELTIKKIARSRLGPIQSEKDPSWSSLLLDGQNRLATMAWLEHNWDKDEYPTDLTDHERAVWSPDQRLVLDMATKEILFVPKEEQDEGFRLPARILTNTIESNLLMRPRWNAWEAQYGKDFVDDGLRWLDRAQDAVRDARVVATNLEYATPTEARDAFLHICRAGVPMSEEDFNTALSSIAES